MDAFGYGDENPSSGGALPDGAPSAGPPRITREDCPHLSDQQWEALLRLSRVVGESTVAAMLRSLPPSEHHVVVVDYMDKERQQKEASAPSRVESLKVSVTPFSGGQNEPLLRWLVELETAIAARRIRDPSLQVAYAMSCLTGRARHWAYGRRLTDSTCWSTYEDFKRELKLAFEPPESEFRSRAEFLDLRQGKRDVLAYAQHARYLVSSIVNHPIDEATQVVTFMKGLKDGPVKTYLFREYPSTLEQAIRLASQEEFSLHQAKLHADTPGAPRPRARPMGGPEPMDLSSASAGRQQTEPRRGAGRCFRCGNTGHFARECVAGPGPAARDTSYRATRGTSYRANGDRWRGRPKNAGSQ